MTEKGDAIHDTGHSYEARLQVQSDLMLQERLSLQGQGGVSCFSLTGTSDSLIYEPSGGVYLASKTMLQR